MFANEMLPSCRHCANYHLTTEQQRQQQQQQHQVKRLQRDKNQECFTPPPQSEKYMWPLSVRKRPNKHEKSLNNESGRNQSNAEHTISRQNSRATRSDNIDNNDQYLQCSSSSGSNNNHLSITMLAETSSKMNGLSTGDENTSLSASSLSPPPPLPSSSSSGALDDHPQCVQSFDVQMWPSIESSRSTSSLPSSSSSSSSASSSSTTTTSLKTSSSSEAEAAAALHCSQWPTNQTCSDFSRNMHMDNINLTSFSVNDRLASENANDDRDDASDLNQCINKNGIVPNGSSSRSVRTDSANNNENTNNYCANKRRKHAYANQRWPFAISSKMNIYSHVLLICVAFVVFGIRNAMVLAEDTPPNGKELGFVENSASE